MAGMVTQLLWSSAGFALSPLFEYLWHARIAHGSREHATRTEHLEHHRTAHTVTDPFVEMRANVGRVGLSAVLANLVAMPLLGARRSLPLSLGLVAGYAASTLYHAQMHIRGPRGAYEDFMWRFHWHHHAADTRVNFGLTNPVFDFLFGTAVVPERVTVSERMAPPWLHDGIPGFAIRRRAATTADQQEVGQGSAGSDPINC
jgi:sterol desaturase/sphingolipid hydroxylase (fatty acid hydroxylase superfamily)